VDLSPCFREDHEGGLHAAPGRRETGQRDPFRARLDQIIDPNHSLGRLAAAIDWGFLEARFGAVYEDGPRRPPFPTRENALAGLDVELCDDMALLRRLRIVEGRVRRIKIRAGILPVAIQEKVKEPSVEVRHWPEP
jgi:hypothetical protein